MKHAHTTGTRLLWALGFRMARTRGGSAHRAALVLAALLALVTVWGVVASHTVHDRRDARMTARNPVPVAADSAKARWWERPDAVGERVVSVVYVRPLTSAIDPPPGLPRWPGPGESFLSPALAEVAPERYGRPAGLISPTGLADGAELVAYINPALDGFFKEVDEPTSFISGFGNRQHHMFFVNSHQFDRGIAELDLIVALIAGVPVVALILVAARSRSEVRERRLLLLDALGIPVRGRAVVAAAEAARPLGWGSLGGSVVALTVSVTSLVLPFTGYRVWAEDLRAALVWLPLCAAATFTVLLGVSVAGCLVRRRRGGTAVARPGAAGGGRWPAVVFVCALTVAAWGSEYRHTAGKVAFAVGAMAALIVLPYATARLARLIGARLARSGGRSGDAARIVAGRWLAARPQALARLSAALVVGLGVIVIGQVITTQFAGPAEAARARHNAADGVLIQVRARNVPATADGFVAAVGADQVVRYSPDPSRAGLRLTGTCRALAALGAVSACPSEPVIAERAFNGLSPLGRETFGARDVLPAPPVTVCACAAPVEGDKALFGFLVINRDGPAGVEAVERAAYRNLIGPMTEQPGQSWYLGSTAQAAQVRWLLDVGLLGIAALAAAGALGAAGVFIEQSQALGPLAVFQTGRRFYQRVALYNLALPLMAVGAVGAAAAALLGGLMINLGKGGWMSTGLLGAGLIAVAVSGVAVAWTCGRTAATHAASWVPQAD
ncbi:hypothetical protein ACIPW5_05175 [Streptomyces sp. NPDC090077]|uniref:hypothetical protein n=1 Tax=Streptomyces sp. NPDC090077 TaxID=3365938 RepID=UPI003821135A